MEDVRFALQTTIQITTLFVILYGLWRMIAITRESREGRLVNTATLQKVSADMKTLEINTNSIQTALNESIAKASHAEGRAEVLAEQKAKL